MVDRPDSMHDLLERIDLMQLPIGVYVIAEDGCLLACNRSAREIFRLPLEGPIVGSIHDLHVDLDGHADLVKAALEAEAGGAGFERSVVHFRIAGNDVFVEDCLRPLRSEGDGSLIGFVGCMVDITDEHDAGERSYALQEKVEELTLDIGRILHANTSTLLMVNQTLAAAAGALAPSDMSESDLDGYATHQIDEQIERVAHALAQALERLLQSGDPDRRCEALEPAQWRQLQDQIGLLLEYRLRIPIEELRNPTLRTSAAAIVALCRVVQPRRVPREPLRDVLRLAQQLQRVVCFADVLTTRATVIQMDFTLRALRDFITAEMRPREHRERLGVVSLMQNALSQLAEFARSSHVEIHWRDRPRNLFVFGCERDISRALANLLHNAIKYSWRRDRGNPPWVSIRTEERDSMVCFDFESWGVPITHDEVDRGLIYQMGYRGKWSTDRGRLGTGIGLTDTQRVALAHGGELIVESQPAHLTGLRVDDDAYYRNPFLTKVTLKLPEAG